MPEKKVIQNELPEGFLLYSLPLKGASEDSLVQKEYFNPIEDLAEAVNGSNVTWVAIVEDEISFCGISSESIADFLENNPLVDMFYADSQSNKSKSDIYLRTDYCSERLRSQQYFGPVVFYKVELLSQILNSIQVIPEFPGYSIALYASAHAVLVGHMNKVLYTQNPPETDFTEHEQVVLLELVSEFLRSHGGGVVDSVSPGGLINSRREVVGNPLVSIVIPTRAIFSIIEGEEKSLVVDAVRSIIELTTYSNYEIVLVADSVAEPRVLKELSQIAGDKLKVVPWDRPFNFSQKMNFGVLHASGDFVLLLNDDVEVISPDWLREMLALAQLPNAGMVGAMLYYEDDTIQHAGHAYYKGSPTHIGLGLPRGSVGVDDSFLFDRRVSGVTAACSLMPTSVFKEVGGFTALLPGNFNDVDLCQKVDWRGYAIYWTPRAELYHFESKTRDAHVHYYELDVIEHRWGLRLDDERFWRGHP